MTNRYHAGKPARLTDKMTHAQHEPGDVGTYDCESLGFHWVFMDDLDLPDDSCDETIAFNAGQVEVQEADGTWVMADPDWMRG